MYPMAWVKVFKVLKFRIRCDTRIKSKVIISSKYIPSVFSMQEESTFSQARRDKIGHVSTRVDVGLCWSGYRVSSLRRAHARSGQCRTQ
jgi:hypothetical protein